MSGVPFERLQSSKLCGATAGLTGTWRFDPRCNFAEISAAYCRSEVPGVGNFYPTGRIGAGWGALYTVLSHGSLLLVFRFLCRGLQRWGTLCFAGPATK